MERFWSTIKAHPYLIAGAVGVVVLWMIWPRGGGDSAATVEAGPGAAALQANAAVQMAANQTSAQVAAIRDTNAQQVALAGLFTGAQTEINRQNTEAAKSIATIQSGLETSLANITLQAGANQNARDITLAGLSLQQGRINAAQSITEQWQALRAGLIGHGMDIAQQQGNAAWGPYLSATFGYTLDKVLGSIPADGSAGAGTLPALQGLNLTTPGAGDTSLAWSV